MRNENSIRSNMTQLTDEALKALVEREAKRQVEASLEGHVGAMMRRTVSRWVLAALGLLGLTLTVVAVLLFSKVSAASSSAEKAGKAREDAEAALERAKESADTARGWERLSASTAEALQNLRGKYSNLVPLVATELESRMIGPFRDEINGVVEAELSALRAFLDMPLPVSSRQEITKVRIGSNVTDELTHINLDDLDAPKGFVILTVWAQVVDGRENASQMQIIRSETHDHRRKVRLRLKATNGTAPQDPFEVLTAAIYIPEDSMIPTAALSSTQNRTK